MKYLFLGLIFFSGLVFSESFGFQDLEVYKASNESSHLCAGDLDNDNSIDLAIINNAKARIDIFLQKSASQQDQKKEVNEIIFNQRFQAQHYTVREKIIALTIFPFQQKQHLAYLDNKGSLHIIGWKENKWQEAKALFLGSKLSPQSTISQVDIDQNGEMDLVVLARKHICIYLQKEGKLHSTKLSCVYENPFHIEFSDLNQDSKLDMVIFSGEKKGLVSYRLQSKDTKFPTEISSNLSRIATGKMVHIPGEKAPVLAVIPQGSGEVHFTEFTPAAKSENFATCQMIPFTTSASNNQRSSAVLDVDGDGRQDIVVSSPMSPEILVHFQNEAGELAPATSFPSPEGIEKIFALAPGKILLFSSAEQVIGVTSFDKEKKRFHFPEALPTDGQILCMDSRDIDQDGDMDIVYIAKEKRSTKISFMEQRSDANFVKTKSLNISKIGSDPREVKLIDLNQDLKIDILIRSPYSGMQALLQEKKGQFSLLKMSKKIPLFPSVPLDRIGEGDLNSNGKKELIVANKNYIRGLQLNKKRFRVAEQINSGSLNNQLETALVWMAGEEKEVLLYESKGNKVLGMRLNDQNLFSETWQQNIPAFDFVSWRLDDLNNDKKSDLVIFGKEKMGILYQNGQNYKWQQKMLYESKEERSKYRVMASGDLNNDGKLDIVVCDHQEKALEILSIEDGKCLQKLTFQIFENTPFGGRTNYRGRGREILIEDINRDGKNDLLLLIHDRILLYLQ